MNSEQEELRILRIAIAATRALGVKTTYRVLDPADAEDDALNVILEHDQSWRINRQFNAFVALTIIGVAVLVATDGVSATIAAFCTYASAIMGMRAGASERPPMEDIQREIRVQLRLRGYEVVRVGGITRIRS